MTTVSPVDRQIQRHARFAQVVRVFEGWRWRSLFYLAPGDTMSGIRLSLPGIDASSVRVTYEPADGSADHPIGENDQDRRSFEAI